MTALDALMSALARLDEVIHLAHELEREVSELNRAYDVLQSDVVGLDGKPLAPVLHER